MNTQAIHLGIVEDHEMIRTALTILINEFENCKVILEAANGLDLQEQLKKKVFPDIILLDLQMPLMDGYETLDWLQENHPNIHVVILSMHDCDFNVMRLLRRGAKAFLKKASSPSELKNAIYSVNEKGFYYNDNITRRLFNILYN